MKDSAHDPEHIYRVLYLALDIAQTEPDTDYDVLISACLLHDIGRQAAAYFYGHLKSYLCFIKSN